MIRIVIAGAVVAVLSTPALAGYIGPNGEQQEDSPYVQPNRLAWDAVVDGYKSRGYDKDSFINRYRKKWYVWQAKTGGDTLIWSKDANNGYDCSADSRPNLWGQCKRYNLRTGQLYSGYVSVRINSSEVTQSAIKMPRDTGYCNCGCPYAGSNDGVRQNDSHYRRHQRHRRHRW